MKTTSELLKDIRKLNNLTQKQFAKRFFVTEKTVSNYETGSRMPDLNFLMKVCEEFNLTLDYFMEKAKKESNPKDLIVLEKNNKFAIFDQKQSVYLTPHLYDRVYISESGNHIVCILKDREENGIVYKKSLIKYSALVDNFGNVREFPDLEFGFNGVFDVFGVCPAYNKKTKRVHLVNGKGEILSAGYIRIQKATTYPFLSFGLYAGYTFKRVNGISEVEKKDLLYLDGSKIDVAFRDVRDSVWPHIKEFTEINVVLKYLQKYGAGILTLCPLDIFKESENYHKIILTLNESLKNSEFYELMMANTLVTLIKYADECKPLIKTQMNKENFYPKQIYLSNKLVVNLFNKWLDTLYLKLGFNDCQ